MGIIKGFVFQNFSVFKLEFNVINLLSLTLYTFDFLHIQKNLNGLHILWTMEIYSRHR